MSAPTATARRSNVLGRYSTPHGGRKLCARVKDGKTFLTDEPVSGRGNIYHVDIVPACDGPGAVEAIVDLYLDDACSSRSIPASQTVLDEDAA